MSSDTIKVTVTFEREQLDDNDVDLSYLDQNDAQMGEGFEEQSRARKEAYQRGDWCMIGIRAKATIWVDRPGYRTNYTLESPGLWGIESDSEESYLQSVYKEQCSVLQSDIAAMGAAEFKV